MTQRKLNIDNRRALRIVSPAYTTAAILFVTTVLAAIAGAFMVRVPIVVHGQGVLMADSEVTHFAIMPETDGRLEEFLVKVGSPVRKGQVIARVSIPRLSNDIQTAAIALDDMRQKAGKLKVFHTESQALAQSTLQQQRTESRDRDAALKDRLARLARTSEGNEELIKRGFMSPRSSDPVATEREQVQDQVSINKRQLMDAESNFLELAQRQRREALDLELQINTYQRQLDSLKDRAGIEDVITSPYDGVIADLLVDRFQPILREKRVATVTPLVSVRSGTNLITRAVVFVPANDGKKLRVGMTAQLLPVIFDEQEFGRIEGAITDISDAVADEDVLLRVFKNQKLVHKLFEAEAPYKVTVAIRQNHGLASGVAWTASRGPDRLLDPGVIVSGWMVHDRRRLLFMLLPAVKRLSESAWFSASEVFKAGPLSPPSPP